MQTPLPACPELLHRALTPCRALHARHPLMPVSEQGEPSLCGAGGLLALSHVNTALLVVGSLPAPRTALLGQPPYSHPLPYSVYACFLSGHGRHGCRAAGVREQEAGGNIWLPSVCPPGLRPPLHSPGLWSGGGAEPQKSRGREVSTFALLTFRSPPRTPPTHLT